VVPQEPSDRAGGLADGSRRFPKPWRADKMPGGYVVFKALDPAATQDRGRTDQASIEARTGHPAQKSCMTLPGDQHRHSQPISAARTSTSTVSVRTSTAMVASINFGGQRVIGPSQLATAAAACGRSSAFDEPGLNG
jgi:hypothetical protein